MFKSRTIAYDPTTIYQDPHLAYLVGVVHVANDAFHPVLVVRGGPRGAKVSQNGGGVEQVGVVEVLNKSQWYEAFLLRKKKG